MESNEFSTLGDIYSRCVSTQSAYTIKKKRVPVHQELSRWHWQMFCSIWNEICNLDLWSH